MTRIGKTRGREREYMIGFLGLVRLETKVSGASFQGNEHVLILIVVTDTQLSIY